MHYYPASFYQEQRLQSLATFVRSMGRKCYIDGSKLAIEIEHQTNNGAIYTTTEYVSTKAEAEALIMDE
jgi:hypothetical protein